MGTFEGYRDTLVQIKAKILTFSNKNAYVFREYGWIVYVV